MNLDDLFELRLKEMALYVIETGCTVRDAANVFGVSKSTVHKDLTKTLKDYYPSLCGPVEEVLIKNKKERHLRGGNATKIKYEKIRNDRSK